MLEYKKCSKNFFEKWVLFSEPIREYVFSIFCSIKFRLFDFLLFLKSPIFLEQARQKEIYGRNLGSREWCVPPPHCPHDQKTGYFLKKLSIFAFWKKEKSLIPRRIDAVANRRLNYRLIFCQICFLCHCCWLFGFCFVCSAFWKKSIEFGLMRIF